MWKRGYSLIVPQTGTSNEYHNTWFHGKIRKISIFFGWKKKLIWSYIYFTPFDIEIYNTILVVLSSGTHWYTLSANCQKPSSSCKLRKLLFCLDIIWRHVYCSLCPAASINLHSSGYICFLNLHKNNGCESYNTYHIYPKSSDLPPYHIFLKI